MESTSIHVFINGDKKLRKQVSPLDSCGSFGRYVGDPNQEEKFESIPTKAIGRTLGMSIAMVTYNVATCTLFTYAVPFESLSTVALIAFPFWSSSHYGEWPCIDFACSSIYGDDTAESNRYLCYRYLPEIHEARKHYKGIYYLCLAILSSAYLYICSFRVTTTKVLLERCMPKERPNSIRDTLDFHLLLFDS